MYTFRSLKNHKTTETYSIFHFPSLSLSIFTNCIWLKQLNPLRESWHFRYSLSFVSSSFFKCQNVCKTFERKRHLLPSKKIEEQKKQGNQIYTRNTRKNVNQCRGKFFHLILHTKKSKRKNGVANFSRKGLSEWKWVSWMHHE